MDRKVLEQHYFDNKHLIKIPCTQPTYKMLSLKRKVSYFVNSQTMQLLDEYEKSVEENYNILLHEQFLRFLELGISIGQQIDTKL